MFLNTQKKLHDAEGILEQQTEELQELRAQAAGQEAELTELRNGYYDGQVAAVLAEQKCAEAQAAEATALAELRHMTKLLAEQASPAELEAAQAQNTELRQQVEALREALAVAQEAGKKTEALQKRVAEQDQRLESNAREMADLTELLNISEARQQGDQQQLVLGIAACRAAISALITPPDTERMDQERLNRAAAALVQSGHFDPDWYLEEYGDVAESGADPALHFIEFGLAEGRNPRAAD